MPSAAVSLLWFCHPLPEFTPEAAKMVLADGAEGQGREGGLRETQPGENQNLHKVRQNPRLVCASLSLCEDAVAQKTQITSRKRWAAPRCHCNHLQDPEELRNLCSIRCLIKAKHTVFMYLN